jgi:hypothetical protein
MPIELKPRQCTTATLSANCSGAVNYRRESIGLAYSATIRSLQNS